MNLKTLSNLTVFLIISFFLSVPVFGQEETSLQILLTDQNSALITQAKVTLKVGNGKVLKRINSEQNLDLIFKSITAGDYTLEIEANGFKPIVQYVKVARGRNVLTVKLEVSEITAVVEISREALEKQIEQTFSRTLTIEEIEALPDNPNDIEAELKRKYGDDILIRVNGFTGGRLPPKEMIASIRVIRSVFDAEFHQAGQTIVDIKTKAGLPKVFGFFMFNFNDAALNARNSFAIRRLPERNKMLIAFVGGPLVKEKTSFTASLFSINRYQKNNIIAIVPNRTVENNVKSGNQVFISSIGVDHNLDKNHTFYLTYSAEKIDLTNAGVGGFNLPETGFTNSTFNHRIRFSESGTLGKKYANEFRVELLDSENSSTPNTRGVTIAVSNAFTIGGAGVDNHNHQQKLDLVDNLLFDRGKHSLKIGGEIELERRKSILADNVNGRFTFTSIANFQNSRPSLFTQRQGTSESILHQAQISLYAQDDVRLYRNFQISFGLRYELQNNLRDYNNFSPRVSFIYSPVKDGKIVFRLGTGIFYNWFDAQTLATIINNDGRQASDLIIRNPGFPNAYAYDTNGAVRQPILPPSIFRKSDDLKNSSIYVTQGGFNYRATKKMNLEAFYTFRRGDHQFRSRDINAPIGSARPSLLFGRITQIESSGNLTESALEIKLDGSLSKGIFFNTRYRLAKSINDYDSVFSLPANSYDTSSEKEFSSLDQRNFLTGNVNFVLFRKIQLMSIFRLGSPLPYTITTGRDDNNDTVFNDRPARIKRNGERGAWLRQFDLQFSRRIPIAKRKIEATVNNSDVAKGNDSSTRAASDLLKNYSIGITVTIQNVFNQTNRQNFVGNQLSPFYRSATAAAPARQVQVGLNFFF